MGTILIGVSVLYLLHNFLYVSAFPNIATESFIIHYLEDRRIIPVRIELNTNLQTEHVASIAGETLYDFNQGKVAYKDFNSSQCFIMDIVEESIEKDRRRLKNLQNGIVRGFYLPTFIIQEELNAMTNFTERFGILLTEFCKGNTISFVIKQAHRRKRDSSGQKGQFTHHSYGHYGHQSNNYAHYGHETHITGTVDENGQIRNQRVNQHQIRSESSHVYPRTAQRNGISRPGTGATQMSVDRNGRKDSTTGSRTSADIPQTQYQMQYRTPTYQQTFGSGAGSSGISGTRQFSLQNSHEGGYQLNLPLGLQAGNTYRAGVRSGGHYGAGGVHPQIATEYQQYPDSAISTGYQPIDQRQPLPPVTRSSYPSTLSEASSLHGRKISPNLSAPAVPTTDGRHVLSPEGIRTPDIQIPFTTSDQRQQGIDYESQFRKKVDHSTIPSAHGIPLTDQHLTFKHTPSTIEDNRFQIPSLQPGISLPSIHRSSETIQSPLGMPGQIPGGIPSSGTSDMHHVTRISRPHGTYPEVTAVQQYIPSGIIPEHQYLQTPGVRQPTAYRSNGDTQGRHLTPLTTPGMHSSYPSTVDAGRQQVTPVSFSGTSAIPSIPHMTRPVSHETNGVRYPDTSQTAIKDEHRRRGTYPGISRDPTDSLTSSVARMRPGETQLQSRAASPLSPDHTVRDRVPQTDRRIIEGQTGFEPSVVYSQDSASSQTQVQTGFEGTAAEASAAGHYRGLGSQTQVQGGYVGNGSFSAQAQSGFTGGVVQSQVQGGKQGGLSGSSAQIERVGSAQSQIQILQPSGSASSTAQGKFTRGNTQVQAQSGKTGGSAGAQAQSTGLSSSHVQVNIGGRDVGENEHFQGTVSASVHGGQSSGQSQTQLQGGYNSGRTYAATAQGGFDTALGFQSVASPVGWPTNFSGWTLGEQQPINGANGQESFGTFRGGQSQLSVPTSREPSGITPHKVLMPPSSQTQDTRVPYPISEQEKSNLLPSSQSTNRGTYRDYPNGAMSAGIPSSSLNYPLEYRRFDERGVVTSGIPQQRISTFGIPEQQTHFGKQIPETQDRVVHEPGSQQSPYPSIPAHALTSATDKHYVSRIPSNVFHPSQQTATMDASYIPTIPSRTQQPGLQTRYPTSYISDLSQISTPSSQRIPSYKGLGEMPVLRGPDGTPYIESSHRHQPMPDATKIQPEQPFILYHSRPQPGPQIQPQYPSVTLPRPQIQPEQTPISQTRPQIQPEQSGNFPLKPQISTTTEKVPISFPSQTTEIKQQRMPGVSEPDIKDCCAALSDLKRRCCRSSSSRVSNKDETSECCRSSRDDIFDFSSDDDLDQNKEPCKVVKAICYIVYKPVGKARVCKPTATNRC